MKEVIGGGIRRGNWSGMEAMSVVITFQTDTTELVGMNC